MNNIEPTNTDYQSLITNIGSLITSARDNINNTLVQTYWQIGRYIVEFEQHGKARAEYGKGLLKQIPYLATLF